VGQASRVLFCDYDGDFEFADVLTQLGFVVDQIRPEGLRGVTVGEHSVYIFSFEKQENIKKALSTCEKLKSAELFTPIIMMSRGSTPSEFMNHQESSKAADAYVSNSTSPGRLLDSLDEIIGAPFPYRLKVSSVQVSDAKEQEEIQEYTKKISQLEKEMEELREAASSYDKALEAQRQYYTPKLKALLEGQKLKVQSETERLKVRLSEVEAKLLEREARIKELEQLKRNQKKKMQSLVESHQKAQQSLRSFYQNKIRRLGKDEDEASPNLAEEDSVTDILPKTSL